ncbi:hypothetical protein [Leptospira langatensis]|uniref:hypothetical protein n=1 Tax=Leptospira langatensis TaxID=2484983 RepID=UPI001FEC1B05|nr:hypothetical protein [Leptospira langatensis]
MFGVFILAFSLFTDCKPKEGDPNPYADLMTRSPLSKMENYVGLGSDWGSRIYDLDAPSKNYVLGLNKIDGFEDSPIPSRNFQAFKIEVIKTLEAEPEPIQSLLKKKLFRIYVCEDLGGSALSGFVREKGNTKGGFILLDAKILDRKANEWISYKENSTYMKGRLSVQIRIESDQTNTKNNALRYILLHEIGHILSATENIGPSFSDPIRSYENFPFYSQIWRSEKVSYMDDSVFPIRNRIHFYSGSISLDKEWEKIYPVLEKTPFPTLYAAANADDFFAESFVSYVHVILEKRPWILQIKDGKKVLFQMENGIAKPALEKQREQIREILEK